MIFPEEKLAKALRDATEVRILITGSREWKDTLTLQLTLQRVYNMIHTAGKDAVLIHGTARGVDTIAGDFWESLGGITEKYPANWEKYGMMAGHLRNKQMVKSGATLCLAFIRNASKGAMHCAALAEKSGIPTVRVTDDDE